MHWEWRWSPWASLSRSRCADRMPRPLLRSMWRNVCKVAAEEEGKEKAVDRSREVGAAAATESDIEWKKDKQRANLPSETSTDRRTNGWNGWLGGGQSRTELLHYELADQFSPSSSWTSESQLQRRICSVEMLWPNPIP